MNSKEQVIAAFPTARAENQNGIFRLAGVLGVMDVSAVNEALLWDTALTYSTPAAREGYVQRTEHHARMAKNAPSLADILNDPAASHWLKTALRSALERDPVDAQRDAEELAGLLAWRVRLALTP